MKIGIFTVRTWTKGGGGVFWERKGKKKKLDNYRQKVNL